METNLDKKSGELKDFLSQYDSSFFLGEIGGLIQHISYSKPIELLKGLSAPYSQLMYLGGLNITSAPPLANLKKDIQQQEWNYIKESLNSIAEAYEQLFAVKKIEMFQEDSIKKALSGTSYFNYFFQGKLGYTEQIIERFLKFFTPFEDDITSKFNLSLQDFIDIYYYIAKVPDRFYDNNIKPHTFNETNWNKFLSLMNHWNIAFENWDTYIPQEFRFWYNFLRDKSVNYKFSKTELESKFGKEKTTNFLSILTCERQNTNYKYFTDENILDKSPIFNSAIDTYQFIHIKKVLEAIYNHIEDYCKTLNPEERKYLKHRDKELEMKIVSTFKNFFPSCEVLHSYFVVPEEQDILILIDNTAFIIESKASYRSEPWREPEESFMKLKKNFESVIQKGYNQTHRVKTKFLENISFTVYSNKKLTVPLRTIQPSDYKNVFSIVITLESFGPIQIDLAHMLKLKSEDEYPWSVSIDDLEVFLLLLKENGKGLNDFVDFLQMRQIMYGRLLCEDELQVCGAYLTKALTIDNLYLNWYKLIFMEPHYQDIFDEAYTSEKLSFEIKNNKT